MNFDTIASISAIIIAICALGVSIWQGIETRKNYRLSVTPNICIIGNWLINDPNTVGVSLENRGIGPAIITKIEVKTSETYYNILEDQESLLLLISQFINQTGVSLCFHNTAKGEMIAAGEKQPIIWLQDQDKSEARKVIVLRDFFFQTTITVGYRSIYGQTFSASTSISPELE